MKNTKTLSRLFLLTPVLVFLCVIGAGIYTRAVRSQKPQRDPGHFYQAAKVTAVPQVLSSIKGLQISQVTLINEGTPAAAVTIEVTNHRNEAVMALDFISGRNDYSGLRFDGFLEEDNTVVIIPPHALKTFTWGLSEIKEGQPISLAAAIFTDGKEEGDKRFLNGIKVHRLHFQKNQREAKARNGGQH